ncbi:MAG: MBL fold metallo-hydrolase [Planctomycetia bacterium]|nr:MBL fold metallo-hydrolase [Planctomycetia bacterium]
MATVSSLSPAAGVVIACIESAPFAENTYVVRRPERDDCVVVDPGFEPGAIIEWIDGQRLTPAAILLTHGHSDHIAGNHRLRRRWPGLPILVGRGDAEKLVDPVANLSAAFGKAITSPPADRLLDDGDRVETAGCTFEVIGLPGHSRGHVVFRLPGSPDLVLGGDVLFREGIGRTDFPDGDFAALAAGIRGRLYPLAVDTTVLPGHGPITTIGHERCHNPFVPAAD